MDDGSYVYKDLEAKYGGFAAPSFTVKIGGTKLDGAKIPISSLSVDIDAGPGAGGCRFTIESQYDYERSKWEGELPGLVEVGKKIEIEVGYIKKKQIFHGFIDDYTIEYDASSAPRVTVSGIDAKGFLMSSAAVKYMSEKDASAVVNSLLDSCVQKSFASKKTVGSLPKFTAKLIQENQTDYAFLCYLAELFCVQFFVVNGEIIFKDVMSVTSPILTLTRGVGLLSFSKTLSLRRQIGKVTVTGNDTKAKAVSGSVKASSLGGSGSEASAKASGIGGAEITVHSEFVRSQQECKQLAQAIFNVRAQDFLSGGGRCVGIPELIPGRYIAIEGLDNRSSDKYYISKVTHEYGAASGYYTTFQVKGAKSK
jgi:phage protein D